MPPPDRPAKPLIVKVKNPKTNQLQDGYIVKVAEAHEPFSYLVLEDGTQVTMRTTLVQVVRLIDEFDDKGNPTYNFDMSGTISVSSPPELKKPASED